MATRINFGGSGSTFASKLAASCPRFLVTAMVLYGERGTPPPPPLAHQPQALIGIHLCPRHDAFMRIQHPLASLQPLCESRSGILGSSGQIDFFVWLVKLQQQTAPINIYKVNVMVHGEWWRGLLPLQSTPIGRAREGS